MPMFVTQMLGLLFAGALSLSTLGVSASANESSAALSVPSETAIVNPIDIDITAVIKLNLDVDLDVHLGLDLDLDVNLDIDLDLDGDFDFFHRRCCCCREIKKHHPHPHDGTLINVILVDGTLIKAIVDVHGNIISILVGGKIHIVKHLKIELDGTITLTLENGTTLVVLQDCKVIKVVLDGGVIVKAVVDVHGNIIKIVVDGKIRTVIKASLDGHGHLVLTLEGGVSIKVIAKFIRLILKDCPILEAIIDVNGRIVGVIVEGEIKVVIKTVIQVDGTIKLFLHDKTILDVLVKVHI